MHRIQRLKISQTVVILPMDRVHLFFIPYQMCTFYLRLYKERNNIIQQQHANNISQNIFIMLIDGL